MHRSEAEGRFGEAEPEGRASVCAEPLCKPSEFMDRQGNKCVEKRRCALELLCKV